jgi:hypothetical protein
MALSEPAADRELLHSRDIALRGYKRTDGLFDIEARLTDTKTKGFANHNRGWIAPGENLHGMWARLTVDGSLTIVAAEASTEQAPFDICPGGALTFGRLAGLSIKPGFLRAANERLGGTEGCTHLRELLQQMATVAFQSTYEVRANQTSRPGDGATPRLLNTCHAYSAERSVVRDRWPQLYTGPAAGAQPADEPARVDVPAGQ